MNEKLVIGTRGSRLALIQANMVRDGLKQAWPQTDIEIRKIVTEGDRNRSLIIGDTGDTGIFVKALEEALDKGQVDMAVHSLKDLPTSLAAGMCLAAVTRRLDPRDVLAAQSPLAGLRPGSRIGTGSLRRAAQLKHLRGDLEVVNIRGNVDSRLRKVSSGELDGVILAAAALLRLGWDDKIREYLPAESFLPAPGQGALAIETREGDRRVLQFINILEHESTRREVTAERAFLHKIEGGCRAPVGALAMAEGSDLTLSAMVAGKDGKDIMTNSICSDGRDPQETGIALAMLMLADGADRLIKEMRCR
jgi:hydroxymethylbilane synthase